MNVIVWIALAQTPNVGYDDRPTYEWEAHRFLIPTYKELYAQEVFNRKYAKWLRLQWQLYPHRRGLIEQAYKENTWCEQVRRSVEVIKEYQERLALSAVAGELKTLRRLIGDDAYYQGVLPPCVPTWRYEK